MSTEEYIPIVYALITIFQLSFFFFALWVICRTSEAADFDRVERPSLRSRLAHVGRAFSLAQAARVLQFICSEHKADEVAQQPTSILLRGVYCLVPLFVGDEKRIVPQQLLTSLLAEQIAVDLPAMYHFQTQIISYCHMNYKKVYYSMNKSTFITQAERNCDNMLQINLQ